jgi:hypothetical protein
MLYIQPYVMPCFWKIIDNLYRSFHLPGPQTVCSAMQLEAKYAITCVCTGYMTYLTLYSSIYIIWSAIPTLTTIGYR